MNSWIATSSGFLLGCLNFLFFLWTPAAPKSRNKLDDYEDQATLNQVALIEWITKVLSPRVLLHLWPLSISFLVIFQKLKIWCCEWFDIWIEFGLPRWRIWFDLGIRVELCPGSLQNWIAIRACGNYNDNWWKILCNFTIFTNLKVFTWTVTWSNWTGLVSGNQLLKVFLKMLFIIIVWVLE